MDLLWTLAVHAACAAPLGRLVWQGFHAELTANPVEFVEHRTGDWALSLLVWGLTCTPLAKLTGQNRFVTRCRRAVGLWAYAYACLHFATWLALDNEFDWHGMLVDVTKRKFVTAGFTAFLLLTPLAITSTKGWIKRLGRKWVKLHMLVYPAALLGAIHYAWLVKRDERWPAAYMAAISLLLGWRLWRRARKPAAVPARAA